MKKIFLVAFILDNLSRQYFPKTLKPLNLSYVLDSEGAIY